MVWTVYYNCLLVVLRENSLSNISRELLKQLLYLWWFLTKIIQILQNQRTTRASVHSHLTCFTSLTNFLWCVGGSGFVQSFLLMRELILERLPEPVNTAEPMEPSEPPEGQVPSAGWSLGRSDSFLKPRESKKRSFDFLTLLGKTILNVWEPYKEFLNHWFQCL